MALDVVVGLLLIVVLIELAGALWCARVSPLAFEAPGARRRWFVWLVVTMVWMLPVLCAASLIGALVSLFYGTDEARWLLWGAVGVGASFVLATLVAGLVDRRVNDRF